MNLSTQISNRAEVPKINPEFQAKAGEILLFDEIGVFGVSAKDFVTALNGMESDEVTVRINSPGGNVFDGIAMFTALKKDPRPVNIEVEGIAASAAALVAMAGDSIQIADNAFMMIHRAHGLAMGDAKGFRKTAESLDKLDGQLVALTAARSGMEPSEVDALMDAETWFNAVEAVEAGLADKIAGETEASALFDLSIFNSAPDALKRRVEGSLRDAGYSRKVAKAAMSEGFDLLSQRDADPSNLRDACFWEKLTAVLDKH